MNAGTRILIVEDQYLAALDCKKLLEAAGYQCVGPASTAADAILLASRAQPDLVLMDIRLASRTGGIEAAKEIFDTYGIRSVFVSGHADAETRRLAQAANPLGWLPKPYSPDGLLGAIKAASERLSLPAPIPVASTGSG